MIWLVALAAAAACDPPAGALTSAAQYLGMKELAAAEIELGNFVSNAQCSKALSPQLASHYFQASAVLYAYQNKLSESADAWSAARRVADDAWFSDLGFEGSSLHRSYVEAAEIGGRSAEIGFVSPGSFGADEWMAVDGTPLSRPFLIEPGLHVVQVGNDEGARYARVFEVGPGQKQNLDLPPASVEAADWRDGQMITTLRVTPEQRRRRRLNTALILAGSSAALFGGAVGSRVAYDANPSSGTLRTMTNTLHAVSIAGGVSSGAVLGLAFLTPQRP